MNCHATRAVLDLHAEKRLTARREKAVTEHLSSCAECRALMSPLASTTVKTPTGDYKARLAAAMKAEQGAPRPAPEPRPVPKLEMNLLPKDLFGVAVAAAALALIAVVIGWSGVPSQRDINGEYLEIAAGRMP